MVTYTGLQFSRGHSVVGSVFVTQLHAELSELYAI